eukprot:Clim_evm8s201 gene=Clim_evmTU8s201
MSPIQISMDANEANAPTAAVNSTSNNIMSIPPANTTVNYPNIDGGRPDNVGILGMDVYFPATCVDQTALEKFDGVAEGKYTIGLGQTTMAFCSDREDINSICMTVVEKLLKKTGVSKQDIGRLEVGTETIIDKSKSVKTVLMSLFSQAGNNSIEGIDTTNACYGGTSALFNAVQWIESSYWDGRYALVVAADIAVYAEGNARPTGGAGAVAMLIGPNAPLVMERGLRGTYMDHAYDFYKPDLHSEYPTVDGKLSVECYLRALDNCYEGYTRAKEVKEQTAATKGTQEGGLLDYGDYFVFHTPYNKLVQKSFGRLHYLDYVSGHPSESIRANEAEVAQYKEMARPQTYFDRALEKAFMAHAKKPFAAKVGPSELMGKMCGNMYTASVYGALASLLQGVDSEQLKSKRVIAFSYGSGAAASMFSFVVRDDADTALHALKEQIADMAPRMQSRQVVPPEDFAATMKQRAEIHNAKDYHPRASVDHFFPGTYYLASIDDKFRRTYAQWNGTDAAATGMESAGGAAGTAPEAMQSP